VDGDESVISAAGNMMRDCAKRPVYTRWGPRRLLRAHDFEEGPFWGTWVRKEPPFEKFREQSGRAGSFWRFFSTELCWGGVAGPRACMKRLGDRARLWERNQVPEAAEPYVGQACHGQQ
jgi:hypothetical protein